MRCEDALVMMLDVEPRDLGMGTGDLGEHLSSCKRCSAVAQTLGVETARLAQAFAGPNSVASAVQYRARRNRVVNYVISPATALAASVMLWLMIKGPTTPIELTFVPAAAPIAEAKPEAATTANSRVARKPSGASAAPRSHALVRLPLPTPALPVATQAVAVIVAAESRESGIGGADLQVDPEPGTLATVMRGTNRNVTIVWLNK